MGQCDACLEGSVWQVNDSGRRFVVVNSDREYVWVDSLDPPTRRRRIRRAALRPSKAKTGYTLVSGSPFCAAEARS